MTDELRIDPEEDIVIECEVVTSECELPKEFIDLAFREWQRLSADPCDFQAFLHFDLTFKAALEKWHQYSWRRMAAAR